jgi:hypothetical protein
MLISFPSCLSGYLFLNDVFVRALEMEVPWWKKSTGASNNKNEQKKKSTGVSNNKNEQKTIKKKSGKSKADQKSLQASVTSSYLNRMCTAGRKALELDERLKEAHCRTLELAK